MEKIVRIEGDPEVYKVIAEGKTTKILSSLTGRRRLEIEDLQRRLEEARRHLAAALRTPTEGRPGATGDATP
jgi:hypothetical protein